VTGTGPAAALSNTTRKVAAELIGSALLAATVVGSGIAAQTLSPDDTGLQLLQNALITGAALVALILALGPVSAAFNPIVTLAERLLGAVTTAQAALFIGAQVVGCSVGVIVANVMFGLDAIDFSGKERAGGGLWLGEVVATFGLLVVIFGVVRSGRTAHVAYAVGGYITAAYWFTSSTSFANPAITLARTLTDTFAGIAPSSAPLFIGMQLLGGALGLAAVLVLYPRAHDLADDLTHLGNSGDRSDAPHATAGAQP
jgi:glycerol uptake facilitator-like aquaporin